MLPAVHLGCSTDFVVLGRPPDAQLLFPIVAPLHEQTAALVTTDHAVGGWSNGFGDPDEAAAPLDPLARHFHRLETANETLRFKTRG